MAERTDMSACAIERSSLQPPKQTKQIDFLTAYKTLFNAYMRAKGTKGEPDLHSSEADLQTNNGSSTERYTAST